VPVIRKRMENSVFSRNQYDENAQGRNRQIIPIKPSLLSVKKLSLYSESK